MKKHFKILSLLLALILACTSLMACGDGDTEETKKKKKKKEPTTVTETVETADPNHEHEWGEWEVSVQPTCAEEGISVRTCECGAKEKEPIEKIAHTEGEWEVIKEPTNTENGLKVLKCTECGEQIDEMAIELDLEWIFETDEFGYCSGYGTYNGDYVDVILNSRGEVAYGTDDAEDISVYANGLFISKDDGVQYLKKVDGTVICSTESLGVTGFAITAGNYTDYNRFFEDGYIFAYKLEETYSDSVCKIGFLNTKGEWIVPLSAENPILKSGTKCTEKEFDRDHFYYYLGSGVLALRVYDEENDYKLYNIEDNALYELTEGIYNLDYIIREKTSFKDGVAFTTVNSTFYKITSDGNVDVISLPAEPKSDVYVDKNGDFYLFGESSIIKNGEIYKELDCKITSGAWIGENCLVIITNPGGKSFFTYVTKDGEFLFDPVEGGGAFVCDISGVGAGSIYTDGEKLVVDDNGKIYYTSKNDNTYIYVNNGVVKDVSKGAFSDGETFTLLDIK